MSTELNPVIAGEHAQTLLQDIAQWGPVTTIVLHAGSVFEFKGPFPSGVPGEGFYNLTDSGHGFTGHLGLNKITHITFQESNHRGRMAYALVFHRDEDTVFKVFLGRSADGQVIASQLDQFQALKSRWPATLDNQS